MMTTAENAWIVVAHYRIYRATKFDISPSPFGEISCPDPIPISFHYYNQLLSIMGSR